MNFCSLFKSITLGTLFQIYGFSSQLLLVLLPDCVRSFSKLKLIKNYLRSSMSTLRLRNVATLSIEQQLTDKITFDIATEEFANKKATKVTV